MANVREKMLSFRHLCYKNGYLFAAFLIPVILMGIAYILKRLKTMDTKAMRETIKKVQKENGKSKLSILLDMQKCARKYGAGYSDYYLLEFYKKTAEERNTYLTRGRNAELYRKYCDMDYLHYFVNKDEFNERFKDYLKRDWIKVNGTEKEKVIDIRNAQQRIAYILRGVMDVSTIDAKNIKIVKNQYKVANLLTEITLRSKQEATEKGLEFRTNFDEAIPEMLYGDSIRLKQIINALISNAIKYTKEGFVELNVNSIVSFDVCRLVVSVKDSGIGVNAEDINKLFQSKTDENDISDKVDESNVTLDVAKKMVNLIGGTITVRSEKNKGSEFTLIVDQKIASSNDKIDNIINEYKKTEDKIKILLVDDDEEERTLLTKKLGGISKLTIAKNGEEGLKRIRNKEKYDVLLIKESMEKLDAYQTIKKAKILEFVPDKIIVLADNKEEEEKLTINGYNAIFFDTSEQQFIKKLNNIIKK